MLSNKTILKINEYNNSMRYKYSVTPNPKLYKNYGIYINVPFYANKCKNFLYYDKNYNLNLEKEFLYCVCREITLRNFKGKPDWFYIDGIAPNALDIYTLKNLINAVKDKAKINNINMKAIPSLITSKQLEDLKSIGINKLNIIANDPEDKYSDFCYSINNLSEIIKLILNSDMSVNTSLIYGISSKNEEDFLNSVNALINIKCPEVSLIPHNANHTLNNNCDIIENEEFRIIEKSGKLLKKAGYKRTSIWTYSLDESKPYNLLEDMLSSNFIGFGPHAISSIFKHTIVNVDIYSYCHTINRNILKSFNCYDQGLTKQWRKFIANFYKESTINVLSLSPLYSTFILLFNLGGYIENNSLTQKGLYFTHKLLKNTIESFPLPLKHTDKILNYNDYLRRKKDAGLP